MECPFVLIFPDEPKIYKGMRLCDLYSHYKINGKHWANYPNCKKENCPLLHPELLGNLIWTNSVQES